MDEKIRSGDYYLKPLRRLEDFENKFWSSIYPIFGANPFLPDELNGKGLPFKKHSIIDLIEGLCDRGILKPVTIKEQRHYQIIKKP